jgi:hypothetical protein
MINQIRVERVLNGYLLFAYDLHKNDEYPVESYCFHELCDVVLKVEELLRSDVK